MKFEKIKDFSKNKFRRITGVKVETFKKMVTLVGVADEKKNNKGGRPNKLSIEDRILMTLEYLREYRTYAHIGASYGLSESNTYTNIRYVENVLANSKEFKLPGKKALLKSNNEFEVILVDATETRIERPKKNNICSTPVKKSFTV
jgi:hypothetical protein